MHTTNLRKVGGSTMLTVPPALLELLNLKPGAEVGVEIADGKLLVEPTPRKTYTLEELLEGWEPPTDEDREWIDAPAAGRELI